MELGWLLEAITAGWAAPLQHTRPHACLPTSDPSTQVMWGRLFQITARPPALTVLGCSRTSPALTTSHPTPATAAVALRRRGGKRRGHPTLIGWLPPFESHQPIDFSRGAARALRLARVALESAYHNAEKGLRKVQGTAEAGVAVLRGPSKMAEGDNNSVYQLVSAAGPAASRVGQGARRPCLRVGEEEPAVSGSRGSTLPGRLGADDRLRTRPFAASGRPAARRAAVRGWPREPPASDSAARRPLAFIAASVLRDLRGWR